MLQRPIKQNIRWFDNEDMSSIKYTDVKCDKNDTKQKIEYKTSTENCKIQYDSIIYI